MFYSYLRQKGMNRLCKNLYPRWPGLMKLSQCRRDQLVWGEKSYTLCMRAKLSLEKSEEIWLDVKGACYDRVCGSWI